MLFKQIQIFLRNCPFSKVVRKTKFLNISELVSEIVSFFTKRKVLYEFPQKCFKTSGRHSLTVFGSLCWEKHGFLIFIPFNILIKIKLFKQTQIFLMICPF